MDPQTSINDVKDWLRQLMVWDNAEKGHILRAGMAQNLGLDPAQYTRPFPGSPSTVTIMNTPTQPATLTGGQPMVSKTPNPWLIGFGILTGLLAGAAGTFMGLKALPDKPAIEQKAQEWQIKWWIDKDGKPRTEVK